MPVWIVGLDLILGVAVEKCLNLQLVHPATPGASEPLFKPKIQLAEPPSQEFHEFHQKKHSLSQRVVMFGTGRRNGQRIHVQD